MPVPEHQLEREVVARQHYRGFLIEVVKTRTRYRAWMSRKGHNWGAQTADTPANALHKARAVIDDAFARGDVIEENPTGLEWAAIIGAGVGVLAGGIALAAILSKPKAASSPSTGPVSSIGLNLDQVGPQNTGVVGSLLAGGLLTLSSSSWAVALVNGLQKTPGTITVSQTSGPPTVTCGQAAKTISICSASQMAMSTPGAYVFSWMTPKGDQGSFTVVVVPASGT